MDYGTVASGVRTSTCKFGLGDMLAKRRNPDLVLVLGCLFGLQGYFYLLFTEASALFLGFILHPRGLEAIRAGQAEGVCQDGSRTRCCGRRR